MTRTKTSQKVRIAAASFLVSASLAGLWLWRASRPHTSGPVLPETGSVAANEVHAVSTDPDEPLVVSVFESPAPPEGEHVRVAVERHVAPATPVPERVHVTGRILDSARRPCFPASARILFPPALPQERPELGAESPTDSGGTFELVFDVPDDPPQELLLVISRPGSAAAQCRVSLASEELALGDLVLPAETENTLLILDEDGRPVSDAAVSAWRPHELVRELWPEEEAAESGESMRTDEAGRLKLRGVESTPVFLRIEAPGAPAWLPDWSGGAAVTTVRLSEVSVAHGFVRTADGDPVADASLRYLGRSAFGWVDLGPAAKTEEDGGFAFSVRQHAMGVGVRCAGQPPLAVELPEDLASPLDLRLSAVLGRDIVVVTTQTGVPVEAARLVPLRSAAPPFLPRESAAWAQFPRERDERVRVTELEPGRFHVVAEASIAPWIEVHAPGLQTTVAGPVDLTQEGPFEIGLDRGWTVTGRVALATDGAPIAKARVWAAPDVVAGGIPESAPEGAPRGLFQEPATTALLEARVRNACWTDDSGRYSIAGLAPGRYRVHAEATGVVPRSSDPVEIGLGAAGVDLDLWPSATLTGRVVSQDEGVVPPFRLRISRTAAAPGTESADDSSYDVETDAEGRFRVTGLPPGTFEVEVGRAETRWEVPSPLPELALSPGQPTGVAWTVRVLATAEVELAPGEEAKLNVGIGVEPDSARVRGEVVMKGTPNPDLRWCVWVWCLAPDGRIHHDLVPVAPDGTFDLGRMPPGQVSLDVQCTPETDLFRSTPQVERKFELAAGEDRFLTIEVDPPVWVRISITDPRGDPVKAHLLHCNPDTSSCSGLAATFLPPGSHIVTAIADGYRSVATRFDVAPGAREQDVRLVMEPASTDPLQLTDAGGKPLAGWHVEVASVNGAQLPRNMPLESHTSDDGWLETGLLPRGELELDLDQNDEQESRHASLVLTVPPVERVLAVNVDPPQ